MNIRQRLNKAFARLQFTTAKRATIYDELSSLLADGIADSEALDMIHAQASKGGKRKNDPVAIAINQWRKARNLGLPISDGMTGWVPPTEQLLIEAGAAKNLPLALKNAITITTSTLELRNKIRTAMTQPILLLLALDGTMVAFYTYIFPRLTVLIPPEQLTGMAGGLYAASAFFTKYSVLIIALILALAGAYFYTRTRWTGKYRVIADRFPPWKIYRLTTGVGFLLSLAALLQAGVPETDALTRMRRHATPYLRERINAALSRLHAGLDTAEGLTQSKLEYPDPAVLDELRVYAKHANFADAIDRVARRWLVKGTSRIESTFKALNIVSRVAMLATIGWIINAMVEIQNQASSAAWH